MSITIYEARQVLTMNPANPEGTHVAVRDGMVLGVGSLEELAMWGEYDLDDQFRDHVICPGFVEAHAHVMEGASGLMPYIGYFDRRLPDGSIAKGIRSYGELIDALKAIDQSLSDPDEVLIARGFDPIYYEGEPRLTRDHLDTVSTTRPVFLYHASGHLATVNSAMLARDGVNDNIQVEGLGRAADGRLDGELREPPAMALCATGYRAVMRSNQTEEALRAFGQAACNEGITTVTDLAGSVILSPKSLAMWQRVVNAGDFPARIAMYNIAAMPGSSADFSEAAQRFVELRREESEKLRFPGVKFILDGSIQGWSALLKEPGYMTGKDHGQLLTVPEQLRGWLEPFHRAGLNVHLHCNGNKTQDLAIDTIESILRDDPWLDHRHTITHAQLTTQAQLRRMARLGICANFFANHLWYWGDQHFEQTVGPERARGLEPCASALREGVSFSLHSDAGVTPLGHLHTMWCAVNRLTPKGRILGEAERISPADALRAVTIDAAYQLHLDDQVGSLEAGKRADFAILEASPLEVDPMEIRDIGIWGTVLGGVPYPAARSS
jgi:predicted amidohydrolase YtcJ